MKLDIVNNTDYKISNIQLRELLDRLEDELEAQLLALRIDDDSVISVVLTDDQEIRKFNHQYRGKDEKTDVLSFGYVDDNFEAGDTVADLIISLETVQKQSAERGVSFQEELAFLFVHGLLHALGYDHDTMENAEKMLKVTEKITGKKLPAYPEGYY